MARCSTAVTPPAAAMWFSLISTASYRPIRWLVPPPTRTAYFCASRRPGRVLRVSTMCVPVPATACTCSAVRLATALSSCKKLRAVRSAVSRARAGPSSSSTTWSAAQVAPSCTRHCQVAVGAIWRKVASTQGAPQTTAASRARIWARVWRAGSISAAVRSPGPTSSARARVASAAARVVMLAGEKSKKGGVIVGGNGPSLAGA